MSSTIASALRRGSCLCKRVRYEVRSEPKSYLVCHCDNCQKFSGSAFLANAFFLQKDVVVTQGQEFIKTYQDADTDSGHPLARSFCKECGSSLFLKNATIDLCIVNTGCLDDKLEKDSALKAPKRELYLSAKRPWLSVQTLETTKKQANL